MRRCYAELVNEEFGRHVLPLLTPLFPVTARCACGVPLEIASAGFVLASAGVVLASAGVGWPVDFPHAALDCT